MLVNRNRPRFDFLGSIEDPEKFVWAILPHAARSFAPSILLLPEDAARAAAVGYLYARMLDTYEDVSVDHSAAREGLSGFAGRFNSEPPDPAPPAPEPSALDARDRTHLLLIERYQLVDAVFMQLDTATRERVVRLIEDMASGMSQFSAVFEQQGGVLHDEQQVLDYCHHVIGLPALFVMELLLGDLSGEHAFDALEVSELIQLANITRDIETDLQRGVAYQPVLESHLGSDGQGDAAADVAIARRDLLLLGSRRAASFRRLVDGVGLPRFSSARAAAVLMMLFTGRHYRDYSGNTERKWSTPHSFVMMVLVSLPAAFSQKWADQLLIQVEEDILAMV